MEDDVISKAINTIYSWFIEGKDLNVICLCVNTTRSDRMPVLIIGNRKLIVLSDISVFRQYGLAGDGIKELE